ncbi:MAG: hypothetical protein GX913_05505 [Clostridiales bacterium]|nr:hypothetical protein [Clostridiales bacterium]
MLIKSAVNIRENQNTTRETAGKIVLAEVEEKSLIITGNDRHKKSSEVSLTISEEALERMKESMEQIRESNSEAKKDISTTSKCMRIASRLVQGDSVPVQDIKYLMKHDIELYSQSMKMRIPKEDPKEWDSELSDEELKEIGQSEMPMANTSIVSTDIILDDM